MKIVIPMSGFGERFRRAGYTKPKPLIEVEGIPIIEHVTNMFPGENDFIFICNREHLENPNYQMKATLNRIRPKGQIVAIAPHKLGPVHAVNQVRDILSHNEPVVINYCDFTCYWDWAHYKAFLERTNCAGSLPAYKGFHPHSLGSTYYAYIKENNGVAFDIREKESFTAQRMNEYASSGTYYFSSAALMFKAFDYLHDNALTLNGEYYVSLAYKYLFKQELPVLIYPLQHFMQWGTPEDLAEYNYWSQTFKKHLNRPKNALPPQGQIIIPMAGMGKRFSDERYATPKPLIPVSGKPMVVQATMDLPDAVEHVFVMQSSMANNELVTTIKNKFSKVTIKEVTGLTAGQACTVAIGLDALCQEDPSGPITVGSCDNGAIYNRVSFTEFVQKSDADVIVWGVRGYPNATRFPTMYSWIETNNNEVVSISVKTPLGDPRTDLIVIGTFTFRSPNVLKKCLTSLFRRDARVNDEFYLDSCINDAIRLGLKCLYFEVDAYLCWGTPTDLKTYTYWQSCFHKWPYHPYRLELDPRISEPDVSDLQQEYFLFETC